VGRLLIKGSQSTNLLNRLLTNNCAPADVMRAKHTFFCNSSARIIDDVLTFRLSPDKFLIVADAVNKGKDLAWISKNKGDLDITAENPTTKVPMLAVQGPKASQPPQRVFSSEVSKIARLRSSWHHPFMLDALVTQKKIFRRS
jgi:aminomethyltransferase